MKRTQLLDSVRNIRKRIVSYLSIMITVILGVSGLLCIFFLGRTLDKYASDYYKDHNFKDLEIISSMGISEDNIQKLREVEDVRDVEGAFNGAFDLQEKQIYKYDFYIALDEKADDKVRKDVESYLDQNSITYLPAVNTTVLYSTENESSGFRILCADKTELPSYVDTSVEIPDSGVLVPEKFLETHSFYDGNTINIFDDKLVPYQAKVAGSYPFYVGITAVMSPAAYQEIFGQEPVWNSYYCLNTDGSKDTELIKKELDDISLLANVKDKQEYTLQYQSTKSLFNMVALIMIGISGVMSFVILLNLNSILSMEKTGPKACMRLYSYV